MKELLRIKDFSVFYTDNIVDNVSFSLNKGDMIGLIGRNGCGKSTLLKGIMGSLKTSGDVLFCGEDFLKMKVKQRAKNISMLTQRIEIIDGITVYDLILTFAVSLLLSLYGLTSMYIINAIRISATIKPKTFTFPVKILPT